MVDRRASYPVMQMLRQYECGHITASELFIGITPSISEDNAEAFVAAASPEVISNLKRLLDESPRAEQEWTKFRLVSFGSGGRKEVSRSELLSHRRGVEILRDTLDGPVRLTDDVLCWSEATVPKLARSIYDERAFDRMPILADALEEAGLADAGILGHLRGAGPHYRSCYILHAILSKPVTVRPFVTFQANFPDDAEWDDRGNLRLPGGKNILSGIRSALEGEKIQCSQIEPHSHYGWEFETNYNGIRIGCLLPTGGLLITEVRRSLADRIRRRRYEEEHLGFLRLLHGLLLGDSRFHGVRWFTRQEYESSPGSIESDLP